MGLTSGELLSSGEKILTAAGVGEHGANAKALLCFVLSIDKATLFLNRAAEIGEEQSEAFFGLIDRRASGEPLQYITGEQYFFGHRFSVDPSVLIPRPETELLAEKAIEYLRARAGAKTVLDLCTGCGALAVSIAKACPQILVTASDLSQDALSVAGNNAATLGVSDRIGFIKSDLFCALTYHANHGDGEHKRDGSFCVPVLEGSANHGDGAFDRYHGDGPFDRPEYDLIVTNPPYIRTGELAGLAREIRDHEPLTALDGGADGLDFYRRIAKDAPGFLRDGAAIMAEIGYDQGEAVSALFIASGFTCVELFKDLSGLDRILTAVRHKETA